MPLFRSSPKKDEVLNHWIGFAEGFTLPPQEFYSALENELARRKIPGLETSRLEYPEGGLLSDSRVYFRLIRERLAFDMCAAPFGTGFFFSCRSVYSSVVVKLWHVLLLLVSIYAAYSLLVKPLGPLFAAIALMGFLVAIALAFRNTVAMGLSDLDALLIKTPAIGPVYEVWFRKDTYFRQDARMFYLEAVSTLFKNLAEDVVAAKGIKLVRQFERAPILGELYKPVTPSPKETTPK
jgi:hypothetical protein